MKRTLLQRVLLALIPVALLTTGSLAYTALNNPTPPATVAPADDAATPAPTVEDAPPRYSTSENVAPTQVAQAPSQTQEKTQEQIAQAQEEHNKKMAEMQQMAEEPMPELVVDKTALTQAAAELERAIEQAKLAVTALDHQSQARHLQEAVNLLAGYKDPAFATPMTTNTDAYRGVSPLLVEARVTREAAEVQWVAAVQQRLEARSKRLGEIATAGTGEGTVAPPQIQGTVDLSQTVGPNGVLGTRGVRPEEQANDLVRRAIRQAGETIRDVTAYGSVSDRTESVVRTLEAAQKIIQIAANR